MRLRAGAARVEITPAPGVELMGYGLRSEPSRGVHDPLYARALYLGGEQDLLLASVELCLITPEQAAGLRARIAEGTGIARERIVVTCTHTHSGPETGLTARARGREAPGYEGEIFGGVVEAARQAHTRQRPARFGWSRTQAFIGRNRRLQDGPIEPEVRVLRVDAADGETLAVAFHHGCHGTVLGHENLEISGDWPGLSAARIEAATGGVALFLLGAHGDVDPRTRGLKDLAIPGQSHGLGFEAVEVLGGELAEAALASLAADGRAAREGPLAAASEHLRLPLHLGELSAPQAEARLAESKAELATYLDARVGELPRLSALEAFARERLRGRSVAETREGVALVRAYLRDKTAPFFVGGKRELDVEVQLLRVGEVALLGLPVEATVAVGRDWKERARQRGLDGAVLSIANGWLRYLPHPRDLAHPEAHQHYEVLSSLLAPGACAALLACGERLLDRLLAPPQPRSS